MIKKIVLELTVGKDFKDIFNEAHVLAEFFNTEIEFDFNGTILNMNKYTKYKDLHERYWS